MKNFDGLRNRKTPRAKWWDYSNDGTYFITICTANFSPLLGKIKDDLAILSSFGEIAKSIWLQIPEKFPSFYIDEFVIMPNHVHGILAKSDHPLGHGSRDAIDRVLLKSKESKGFKLPHNPDQLRLENPSTYIGGVTGNQNPMLHEGLPRVVRWYKGRVSFESSKVNNSFGWHSRFHEHIIQSQDEYLKIANYIRDNPKNWNRDRYFIAQ